MSKWKYFFAGALVALISVGIDRVVVGQGSRWSGWSGSLVRLSPEDYIEISQLYGMYARDNDPGSLRDASWMFTEDGIWCSVPEDKASCAPAGMLRGSPFTGTKELQDWFSSVRQDGKTSGTRKLNTSYVIVGTPDGGARGSVYRLSVSRRTKDGPVEITEFGKYEDKLVKTPQGWRIKERVSYRDSWVGANTPTMEPSPVPGNKQTEQTSAVSRSAAQPFRLDR